MKDEVRTHLAGLFAQEKHKADVVTQENFEKSAQAEENDAKFLRVRDEVIVPAMREMADFIAEQGWDSTIFIEEGQTDARGLGSPAKVAMTFFQGGKPARYRDHDYPHVWATHSRGSSAVWFPTSTISPGQGGSSNSGSGVALADVTAELVQGHIANVLSRVLKALP